MKAYQILRINRDGNGIDTKAKDSLALNLKILLNEIFRLLNENQHDMSNFANNIEALVNKMQLYILAYSKICNEERRRIYKINQMFEQDIDENNIIDKRNSIIRIANDKKKQTAYQVLGISKISENEEDPEKSTIIDEKIKLKLFEYMRTIMMVRPSNYGIDVSTPIDIEALIDMANRLERIFWAYNKINTSDKRKRYNEELVDLDYKTLSEKANKEKGRILSIYKIDYGDGENYEFTDTTNRVINLSRKSIIKYDVDFLGNESSVNEYFVTIKKGNQVNEYTIYSNIDIKKLAADDDYSKKIICSLLSEKSLERGKKYLEGYVGELNDNGEQKFNIETIAAINLQRIREREELVNNYEKEYCRGKRGESK